MKCPHCQMDDVLISTSSDLRLLSFVFNTITCPHCSGVFAVPKPKTKNQREPKVPVTESRSRYAA